jgi:hypothetical protein
MVEQSSKTTAVNRCSSGGVRVSQPPEDECLDKGRAGRLRATALEAGGPRRGVSSGREHGLQGLGKPWYGDQRWYVSICVVSGIPRLEQAVAGDGMGRHAVRELEQGGTA